MNQINIRIAATAAETQVFWQQLNAYFVRDIHTDSPEDLEEFQSPDYHKTIETLRVRETDPLYFLFFHRDGQEIGFAMPVIYNSEDGKCFILEFCVYPEFRGSGTGTACARTLMEWATERGALYYELNAGGEDRRRFWGRLGFLPNGLDEWGVPLMLCPPKESVPIEVRPLAEDDQWQFFHLQNSYKAEIGEEPLSDEAQERLKQAVKDGRITFFMAYRRIRCIGMCSVAQLFSTYGCKTMAVFEDFYVEPAWRHTGAARLLTSAAQSFCRQQGLSSLWVGCAPCDKSMYQSLGFDLELGELLTWSGK